MVSILIFWFIQYDRPPALPQANPDHTNHKNKPQLLQVSAKPVRTLGVAEGPTAFSHNESYVRALLFHTFAICSFLGCKGTHFRLFHQIFIRFSCLCAPLRALPRPAERP